MTAGDWALLIGLLFNAGAVIYAARKVRTVSHKVDNAVEVVGTLAGEMNGMKEALIAAARLEGFHTGEAKGRADSERERLAVKES